MCSQQSKAEARERNTTEIEHISSSTFPGCRSELSGQCRGRALLQMKTCGHICSNFQGLRFAACKQSCAPCCITNGAAGMSIIGRRGLWAGSCPNTLHLGAWWCVSQKRVIHGNAHARHRTASFLGRRPCGHKSELCASPSICPWGGGAGEKRTGTPWGDGPLWPLHCPAFALPQALTLAFSNLQ